MLLKNYFRRRRAEITSGYQAFDLQRKGKSARHSSKQLIFRAIVPYLFYVFCPV